MKKRDEGYVLAFVLIVIVVICLVAVSMMNVSLRNVQAQKASIERMEEKYRAQGKLEQAVANLEQLILNTNWTDLFGGGSADPVETFSEGESAEEVRDPLKETAFESYLEDKGMKVVEVASILQDSGKATELTAKLSLDIEPTADAPYRVDTEITLTVTVKQVTDDPLKFELKKSGIEYTSYSISAVDPETIPKPTPTPTPAPAAQEVS